MPTNICLLFLANEELFLKKRFFKRFYLFSVSGEGREKERERNTNVWVPLAHFLLGTWSTTQASALIGNQTGDPLLHSPAFNPLSYTRQGRSFPF